MYKHNDIKSLQNRIDDLQELQEYIYSRNKKKIIDKKIRDLVKELKLIKR